MDMEKVLKENLVAYYEYWIMDNYPEDMGNPELVRRKEFLTHIEGILCND